MFLQNIKNLIISTVYVILQIALYIIILTNCFGNVHYYCYASICLSLVFALTLFNKKTSYYLMLCAFVFTLISDTFLVLLEGVNKEIAMTTFSVTQICYALLIAYKTSNKNVNIISLISRAAVFVIVEILARIVVKENFNYLIFITMFYFANIVLNVAFSFFATKINWIFCAGIILFLCCDIFVGLQQLCSIIGVESGFLYEFSFPSFNIIWLFYLPSQVLLGLSLLFNNKKTE